MFMRHTVPTRPEYRENGIVIDRKITEKPLSVLCFGYQISKQSRNEPLPERTTRPNGRCDYQLLYIKRGSMRFSFNKGQQTLTADTLVLFRPGVPQFYSRSTAECHYYYIHFSGNNVEELFKKYNINQTVWHYSNGFKAFEDTVKTLDAERQNPFLEDMANSLLEYLLALIGGTKLQQSVKPAESLQQLLLFMENSCGENLPIDAYANHLGFSRSYFIRYFKKATGQTPQQYILACRLKKAEHALLFSEKSIQQISDETGFYDVHYFYKFFKRQTDLTPKEYRQKNGKKPIDYGD